MDCPQYCWTSVAKEALLGALSERICAIAPQRQSASRGFGQWQQVLLLDQSNRKQP